MELDSHQVREIANAVGFDLVGICPAVEPQGLARFHEWLDSGFAGEMQYLEERRDAYSHPRHVMDGARSIVMLGLKYRTEQKRAAGSGRISRYAWYGTDYHDLIHTKLKEFKRKLQEMEPEATFRGVVDTAPLLERDFASLAGLGWQGKNTMLISKTEGSWFFLAALLTDLKLDYDQPFEADHCGTCTACLDACPTDAFPEPYVLDGTRCISYFTIESKELAPDSMRSMIEDWVFGCDICQEVCPWNRKDSVLAPNESRESNGFEKTDQYNPLDLHQLFDMDETAFRSRFRKTPFWRTKRRGMLRNAAIVLGNQREAGAVPALVKGLNDVEEIVRASSAWALGEIGKLSAKTALLQRNEHEKDPDVQLEIINALEKCPN